MAKKVLIGGDSGDWNSILNEAVRALLLENEVIESEPPSGKCKVTNLYVDPNTEKLVVEYDDQPV